MLDSYSACFFFPPHLSTVESSLWLSLSRVAASSLDGDVTLPRDWSRFKRSSLISPARPLELEMNT